MRAYDESVDGRVGRWTDPLKVIESPFQAQVVQRGEASLSQGPLYCVTPFGRPAEGYFVGLILDTLYSPCDVVR